MCNIMLCGIEFIDCVISKGNCSANRCKIMSKHEYFHRKLINLFFTRTVKKYYPNYIQEIKITRKRVKLYEIEYFYILFRVIVEIEILATFISFAYMSFKNTLLYWKTIYY